MKSDGTASPTMASVGGPSWRDVWWLLSAFAGFVLLPASHPKFLCLGAAVWLACRVFSSRFWSIACAAFATALFATTFLLTPVCASAAVRGEDAVGIASPLVQLALLAFGGVWVWLAQAPPLPVLARIGASRWRFALLWPVLLMGVFFLPWAADIAYGGDEHYHFKALVLNRVLGVELLQHGWFTALLLTWFGAGVWLAGCRLPFQNRAVLWALAGLALAACAPWLYPAEAMTDAFNQDRMLRYPGGQPWFSAWLWELTRGDWGRGVLFGFETLRFTPVLAVLFLGFVLVQERRWRIAPPVLPLLGALAVATVPTLMYHGTLLYLELALLPPLVLLLRESRRWLLAAPASLAGSNAWWAALALGYLKDTGIIAIGLLWLSRAVVRGIFLNRRGEWSARAMLAEARVAFVMLGPGLLYLALRSWHGSRPYQPHFENFLSGELWWQAVRGVVDQFGLLWLPALSGAWLLARRRAWLSLLAPGTLFVGIGLFHLLEEPRWVGLARFNLLLLPTVLALAWEGLGALLHWRSAALAALLAFLAGNALLSPVNATGQRAVWGGSGERWYDYTDCLLELQRLKSDARLGIANLSHEYGINLTLQRLNWWADVVNLPVADVHDAEATLRRALESAGRGRIQFVIFRWDNRPTVPESFEHAGYVHLRDYPSRGGTLKVFAEKSFASQLPR